VFFDPLPSNGHAADHIEKNSCNTFSIVAWAYFGRCLEMRLYVRILKVPNTGLRMTLYILETEYGRRPEKENR
jgi:hypothetical protein